ncbi:MAG: YggS family pyridoxal phosphate enzyme [Desulfobulbaceae bacterium]
MILENLTNIKHRIARAASRVNRSPANIKLVAVSKRIPPERILAAIDIGHSVFGENYVQEAVEKIPYIQNLASRKVVFHFIGNLQSSAALNKTLEAYVQVNIGAEKQKSGVRPEDCEKLLHGLIQCQFLRITGLMTMPPYCPDPENTRPFFKHLRQLSEALTAKGLLGQHGPVELSMGMSGDFEVAIEEGATVVRIGTALFGARTH